MLNLAAVIEQHARRRPEAEAVVCGGTRLTYGALNAWANQIAGALAASGIRRGDHVALLCPNLPYFPAVYFAILKTGATVVPLNVLLKPREIAYHLRDSDAKALFCFRGTPELPMIEAAKAAVAVVPSCKRLIVMRAPGSPESNVDSPEAEDVVTLAEFSGGQPATFQTVDTSADDTAIILYTSGTTGQPKGAELTHLNMTMNGMISAELCAGSADETGRHATASHVAALSCDRANGADAGVSAPRRNARVVAQVRSRRVAFGHGRGTRDALGRRADDVLDAAQPWKNPEDRLLRSRSDAPARCVGRRADARRADAGIREDIRRAHHRRVRPV